VIVGDPSVFAIESEITRAYERLSFRALGYFVIHVCGRSYGVRSPEALLARSFDAVQRRILEIGLHAAPFASGDAGEIADSVRTALFSDCPDERVFWGLPRSRFAQLIYSKDLVWAPDGDEAFDDGSYVLQFDVESSARVIAFRSVDDGFLHDPSSLSDLRLPLAEFYGVLKEWAQAFEAEWRTAPKAAILLE